MTPPLDLVDAILQQLRQSPCAQLFGDTWNPDTQTGVQKFFADYADETPDPQVVVFEPGENYSFMSPGPGNNRPYQADGSIQVAVIAPGRANARDLGDAVARALNDATLEWPNTQLTGFRLISSQFAPITQTGPNVPAVFNRMMTFQYQYFGSL